MAPAEAESSSGSLVATKTEGARCRVKEPGVLSATVLTVLACALDGFDVLVGLEVLEALDVIDGRKVTYLAILAYSQRT